MLVNSVWNYLVRATMFNETCSALCGSTRSQFEHSLSFFQRSNLHLWNQRFVDKRFPVDGFAISFLLLRGGLFKLQFPAFSWRD